MLSYGLRSGGGIGDVLRLKDYSDPYYWSRLFFDWVFFFLVNLIIINVFNGIIVDTFQAIREDTNKHEYVTQNICFICNRSRTSLFSLGENYEEHVSEKHNVVTYIKCFLMLRRRKKSRMNLVEEILREKIDKSSRSIFPIES